MVCPSNASSRYSEPLPRNENDRKATDVDRRLEQLDRLFRKKGFLAFGMADLAAALRCSKRTLYQLAPSKHELIERVLERRFKRIREQGWEAAARHDPAPERLWAYLAVGTSALSEMGDRLLADIEAHPGAKQIFNRHQRARADGIRQIIAEGVRTGHFEGYHAGLVAEVMMVSFTRMREPEFLRDVDISLARAWEELARLIRTGLYPRKD